MTQPQEPAHEPVSAAVPAFPVPPAPKPPARKKKKPVALWVALLLGGGAAAYFLVPKEPPLEQVQAVQAERGTLVRTVTGTGQVRSDQSNSLRFRSAGTVEEVLVKVGDKVKKGQLLARLGSDAQQRDIEAAEAAVRSAQADLSRAQAEVERARGEVTRAERDIPKAQADVERARAELKRAQGDAGRAQGDITKAEAEVTRAQAELDRARASGGDAGRERERDVANAQRALASARSALGAAERNVSLQRSLQQAGAAAAQDVTNAARERDEAASKVAQAEADLAFAQSSTAGHVGNAASVAQAEAGLETAQAALAQARSLAADSPAVQQASATLTAAQAGLAQAQGGVQQAWAGVKQAQAGVTQAQAALESAQLKVQNLRGALADLELRAPAAGVVSVVNVSAGNPTAGDAAAIELTDPSRLYLQVPFDETRSTDLQAGQAVKVDFDALPGQPVEGRVQSLDPVAKTSGQAASVQARISLEGAEGRVRPGYTALATVTTLEQANATLIPLETTREEGGKLTVWTLTPEDSAQASKASGEAATAPRTAVAKRVTVTVSERNANEAAVTGISANDWVVTPYPSNLEEGTRVNFVPQEDAGGAADSGKAAAP